MVLLVVIRNNTMRNVTDVLIAHLSLSDTMLIVFSTPALLLQEIGSDSFQPGDIFPKICAGVVIFCSIVSVFTVVAIAIER
jgi:hypothetical protein